MRITDVEAIAIKAQNSAEQAYWGKASWGAEGESDPLAHWNSTRFPHPGRMRPSYSDGFETVLVRIETDTGIVGWGEAKAPVAPRVTKYIIQDLFRDQLIGADPRNVEVIWETLYASMRLRAHDGGFMVEALSGVDIALWDIIGKGVGEPVHRLLGGAYRDRVLVYASGVPATRAGRGEADHTRMIDAALSAAERGFTGLKMAIGLDPAADVASVAAVRDAVGPDTRIFTDAAGNYDVGRSILVGRELEQLDVGFLEAPLPFEHVEGYAEVARALALPIANDVIKTRYHVLEYLRRAALDVVQPDVCRSGGITELKRISVLADAFGVAFTPHVSIGSAIHFVASAHVAAASVNLHQMEYWFGANPLGDAILLEPVLGVVDGHLPVPQGPGLGIEVDESVVRRLEVS